MRFKEVEILLDKDITELPATIACPNCGRNTKKPEYKCFFCATQIVLVEESPQVILD